MTGPVADERSAEAALRTLGIRCVVEARARLAVVIPAQGEVALEDEKMRRAALEALCALGFTHGAVELAPARVAAGEPDSIVGAPGA